GPQQPAPTGAPSGRAGADEPARGRARFAAAPRLIDPKVRMATAAVGQCRAPKAAGKRGPSPGRFGGNQTVPNAPQAVELLGPVQAARELRNATICRTV